MCGRERGTPCPEMGTRNSLGPLTYAIGTEFSSIYCSLFQVARRIASSRRPSCSFPPHESASFLHASASSYRPVWDYLSTILTSSPSLLAPSFHPSDHLAWA